MQLALYFLVEDAMGCIALLTGKWQAHSVDERKRVHEWQYCCMVEIMSRRVKNIGDSIVWKLHSRFISACGFLIAQVCSHSISILTGMHFPTSHRSCHFGSALSLLIVAWPGIPSHGTLNLEMGHMNFGDSLSCFIIQKTSTRHSSCMNTCLLPEELEGFLAIFFVSFRFFFLIFSCFYQL